MPKAIATTPSWYWPDRVPRVLGTPPYYIAVDHRSGRPPERTPDRVGGVDAQGHRHHALVVLARPGAPGARDPALLHRGAPRRTMGPPSAGPSLTGLLGRAHGSRRARRERPRRGRRAHRAHRGHRPGPARRGV